MRPYFLAALLLIALAGRAAAQVGRVTGIVKDDHGDLIKGATIIAENVDASPSSFTASSDEKGRFDMIGLRSGVWQFRASAPGYATDSGELNVRTMPGVTPPVTFTLQKLVVPPSALGSTAPKDLQSRPGERRRAVQQPAMGRSDRRVQRDPAEVAVVERHQSADRLRVPQEEGLRQRHRRVQRSPQDRSGTTTRPRSASP